MTSNQSAVLLIIGIIYAGASCQRPAQTVVLPPPKETAPTPAPQPVSLWPATLADALRAFDAGRYDDADRILQRYSISKAGNAEGAESDFWRALLRSDPDNTALSTRERIALFDDYLAAGSSAPRYVEAQILRRLLESLDSTRAAVTALRTIAEARDKARDDEVRRLSEDLDKTMAELERIRRRLTPKTP